jgi:hypothetical protein
VLTLSRPTTVAAGRTAWPVRALIPSPPNGWRPPCEKSRIGDHSMLGFGTPEVILLAVVAVVVVGAARFPHAGRGSRRNGGLARSPRDWTRSDWILLAGVVLLGVVAVGLALSR